MFCESAIIASQDPAGNWGGENVREMHKIWANSQPRAMAPTLALHDTLLQHSAAALSNMASLC